MKVSELEDGATLVTESGLKTALSRLKNDLENERLDRERQRNREKLDSEIRRQNLLCGIMAGAFGGFTVAMIFVNIVFHH